MKYEHYHYYYYPLSSQAGLCVPAASVPSRIYTLMSPKTSREEYKEKSTISVPPPQPTPQIQISQPPIPNPPSPYPSPVSHSWVPGAQGTTGLSDLQQPLKEISFLPSQPTRPSPTSPPSLSGPPNKNKVTLKREWPGLPLCRSVSGYLIVTHGLGP